MIDKIISKSGTLEKALDAAWLRNEALSNNIANADTPGYKRSDVSFGDALAASMGDFKIGSVKKDDKFLPIGNDARSIPAPEVSSTSDDFTSMRRDNNNVDVDVEMAELAKNAIKYNALIAQLNKQFSIIKYSISGGR